MRLKIRFLGGFIAICWSMGCGGDAAESTEMDARLDTVDETASHPDQQEGTDVDASVTDYCPVVDYEPCGGDLVGRWSLLALCPEDPEAAAALYESPFDDLSECIGEGNETIGRSVVEGTFEFDGEGQVAFDTSMGAVVTWVFTDRCLEATDLEGGSSSERCQAMNREHLSCEYAPNACRCVSDPMVEEDEGATTYTVNGNEVVLGDDPPASYCIKGESLIMDYYLYHPVSWRYWVFERR